MSLETETVLDRRNLRRKIGTWRALALLAGAAVAGLIATRLLPASLADQNHIARITIEGMITEDRDVLRLMKRVADNNSVKGVVLFINSPGGTTTGGEALYEGIRNIAAKKPVVAQFGTVAASAGYIVGLASDHIVTRGNTITGSVGVLFQWPEVSGLLDKVGVKMNEIKSGPLKAVPSIFEPLSTDGRKSNEAMVAESFKWFLDLVKERRKIDTAAIPGLEQGRVFSGREALTHKMVDAVGGEAEAIKWLEEKRSTPKDLRVVDWKPRRDRDFGWLGFTTSALRSLIGLETSSGSIAQIEKAISVVALDGLVSVWQPSER